MPLVTARDIMSISWAMKRIGGKRFAKFLMWILGLNKLNRQFDRICHHKGRDFTAAVLEELKIKVVIPEEDLARIPAEGPFITISNHPFGGLDGISILTTILEKRPDYRFLANFLLTRITPISDLFLAVNPFETHKDAQSSLAGIKKAFDHLARGAPLGIFPAGEVSTYRLDTRSITDREWQNSILKFIKKAGVPVIPVYFEGHNSLLFHILGIFHPMLRTIKLPSELLNKKGKTVRLRIGNPIPLKDQDHFRNITHYGRFLRTKTYSLQVPLKEKKKAPVHHFIKPKKIIDPVDPQLLKQEVESVLADFKLFSIKNYHVVCAPADRIPNVLTEIGRLREVTYREVGEGTNKSLDLDAFDPFFQHLFIWDEEACQIVGAYRAGKGKELLAHDGLKGFYIYSLFRMSSRLIPTMASSIELGRSFIVKEYQKKTISLFLLWKGILYFLLKNPEYQYLVGPVSMSNEFSDFSKALTIEFIRANYWNPEVAQYVRPRSRFRYKLGNKIDRSVFLTATTSDLARMERFVQDIEPGFRLPVLLKKYIGINARIVGFNVDREFSNCLDGLMILDLYEVPMNTIESLSKEINDASILERFQAISGENWDKIGIL